jgi:hypothetical protein
VLQGLRRQFGLDYSAVFSPVVRASTVRLFFSIVASMDLECHSVDIENAFVQDVLSEEIYMKPPPAFDECSASVFKLHKSLYGLKQASRVSNQTISSFLQDLGCVVSKSDGALFLLPSAEQGKLLSLLYVDDIQIAAKDVSQLTFFKHAIQTFAGRDLGETTYFLQMEIVRDRERRIIKMRQQRHIEKLVNSLGLSEQPASLIPMSKTVYTDSAGQTITTSEVITQYRSVIGMLMHLANDTRPDITSAVSYSARVVNSLSTGKFARVSDVVKYLNGTSTFALHLGGAIEQSPIYAWCDSDFAACTDTRKSTTGYAVQCGIGSICWKSVLFVKVQLVGQHPRVSTLLLVKLQRNCNKFTRWLFKWVQILVVFPVGIDNEAAIRLIQLLARTRPRLEICRSLGQSLLM